MTQRFRVLVLDDSAYVGIAFEHMLDVGREALPAAYEVVAVERVEQVRQLIERGQRFDVAIIDLGLGARQVSGLGALELLAARSNPVPAMVHTEYQEQTRRLLFLYAAFSWFAPVALLPKTGGGHPGQDLRSVSLTMARMVAAAAEGRSIGDDLAQHFRRREGVERAFEDVIKTREDLLKWRSFVTLGTSSDVARDRSLSARTIENWVADKVDAVKRLLREASDSGMDVTDATVQDRSAGRLGQSVIHQFARSQSWFFMDPTVDRHFR